jgi:hypothetical protein
MIKILLEIADKYGLDVAQLALIGILGWKFATNHFRHLKDQVNKMETTLNGVEKNVGELSERVAKIEGKIE